MASPIGAVSSGWAILEIRGRDHVLDQIINFAKPIPTGHGNVASAPKIFKCGFGEMPIPPTAVAALFLRANIA